MNAHAQQQRNDVTSGVSQPRHERPPVRNFITSEGWLLSSSLRIEKLLYLIQEIVEESDVIAFLNDDVYD